MTPCDPFALVSTSTTPTKQLATAPAGMSGPLPCGVCIWHAAGQTVLLGQLIHHQPLHDNIHGEFCQLLMEGCSHLYLHPVIARGRSEALAFTFVQVQQAFSADQVSTGQDAGAQAQVTAEHAVHHGCRTVLDCFTTEQKSCKTIIVSHCLVSSIVHTESMCSVV